MIKNHFFYTIKKTVLDVLLVLLGFGFFYWFTNSNVPLLFKIIALLPDKTKLVSFTFPLLLSIMPIVVAVAILVYQIYYNRYTLKELQYSIKIEFSVLFTLLFIEMFSIIAFWILLETSSYLYFIIIYFLVYLVIRLFVFILKYNQINIQYYIQKIYKNCIKYFEKRSITKQDMKEALDEINEYFSESVEKKENNYIRSIILIKEKLLLAYLKKSNDLLLNKNLTSNDSDSIYDTFIDSISSDYKNLISSNTNRKVIKIYNNYIINIIKSSIVCSNDSLYTNIVDKLASLMFYDNDNSDKRMFSNALYIFEKTYSYTLHCSDINKCSKIVEEKICQTLLLAELFINNSKVLKELILIIFDMLSETLETKTYEDYLYFYKSIIHSLSQLLKHIDKGESEFLVIALNRHFQAIKTKNDQIYFENFVFSIFEFIKLSIYSKNKDLVLNTGYLLADILSEKNKFVKIPEFTKKRCECILRCIEVYPDISIVYFPNYADDIKENVNDIPYLTNLKNNFCDIFDRLIRTDESEPLYYFLDCLNDCIDVFEQMDRNQQELMFDIYEDILRSCIAYKAFSNFNLAIYKFNYILKNIDSENKISESLLFYILDIFDHIGLSIIEENDPVLQDKFIHNITNLSDKIHIIDKDKKYKERIIEIVFHFGIEAIETKNDNLLKHCSNNLGWYAIKLYKAGDIENFKRIIEATTHLYNLAVEQKYDNSMLAFLGTLFIILGAYSHLKRNFILTSYIKNRIESLKDTSAIKTSKRLREYSHKYWDKTFEGDSKQAINEFYITLKI